MSLEKSTIKTINQYLEVFYANKIETEYLDYDLDYPIKRNILNKDLIDTLPQMEKKRQTISIKIIIK